MAKTLKQISREIKRLADKVPDVKLPKHRAKAIPAKPRMGARRGG
jgi:hypothetical protein